MAGVLAVVIPLILLIALGVFKYPLELQHLYLMIPYVLALYAIAEPRYKATSILVRTLLSVHLLSVVLSIGTLVAVPYDGTPDIVNWIETHGYGIYLGKSDVAVFPDPSISTVTLYGGLPDGAYALSAERFETYTPWDTKEPRDVLSTAPPKLPTHLPGITGPYLLLTYFPNHLDYGSVDAVLLTKFQDGPWVHWYQSPGAYLYLVKSRTP